MTSSFTPAAQARGGQEATSPSRTPAGGFYHGVFVCRCRLSGTALGSDEQVTACSAPAKIPSPSAGALTNSLLCTSTRGTVQAQTHFARDRTRTKFPLVLPFPLWAQTPIPPIPAPPAPLPDYDTFASATRSPPCAVDPTVKSPRPHSLPGSHAVGDRANGQPLPGPLRCRHREKGNVE